MKHKLIKTLCGSMLLGFTLGSFAQTPDATTTPSTKPSATPPAHQQLKPHPGKAHHKRNLLKQLNLTDEQKKQMQQVMQDYKPKLKEVYQKMKDNRHQLRALKGQTGDDAKAKITAIAHSQGQLLKQMIMLRSEFKGKVYNILTQEQRQKLEEIKKSIKQPHPKHNLKN